MADKTYTISYSDHSTRTHQIIANVADHSKQCSGAPRAKRFNLKLDKTKTKRGYIQNLNRLCMSKHFNNHSKDDATVEVSIAKPLSSQPKEESNSPIPPPNPMQHPPENLGSDKLPEATLLSKPVQKREPLKQLPINLKPQIHSSSPSPQKKHSPVNKTPESHNLTSGLPSPVTNPQPRPLRKAKCPHCSKEYAFRSGLTKHLKKYHSDKTSSTSSGNIKCNQCNSR